MDKLLELKNISKSYSGVEVLKGITIDLEEGEVLCLVGENGAGKTTLVKLLCGLYQPTKGEIYMDGVPVSQICKEDYYKWTQWLFLQLYKKGLAYKKGAAVNWCEKCATVLANEQVIDGKCWRCDSDVTKKNLEQWFLKITDYAEILLEDLEKLTGWGDNVKTMQANWIGKSKGTILKFQVKEYQDGTLGKDGLEIPVYTTRPDTAFGITYLVVAPEYVDIEKLTTPNNKEIVEKYRENARKMSEIERLSTERVKTGVPLGTHIINPLTGRVCPIWVADYAIVDYGTGAVMAVPAHDERDLKKEKKLLTCSYSENF